MEKEEGERERENALRELLSRSKSGKWLLH